MWVARKGTWMGLGAAISRILPEIKLPTKAIGRILRNALIQTRPDLDKTRYLTLSEKELYLDLCDQGFEFLVQIFEDTTIPFEEKQKIARNILTKSVNIKTKTGIIACLTAVCYFLAIHNPAGLYILFQSLIEAIRKGKISRAIARLIVRRLQKNHIDVDPELLEIIE